jgi:hypothetical protein
MQSPAKRSRQDHQKQQQQPPPPQQQQQQQVTALQFRGHAVAFLASRLAAMQHCPQAASLQLRPSLHKLQEELTATITSAVQLKQNASLLVLGEPGIGKTLVRTGWTQCAIRSPHSQPCRLAPAPAQQPPWCDAVVCCHAPAQVLERAVRSACSQYNTDGSNPTLGVVRLSGVLHCEERAAFQEIAHQLCRCVWLRGVRSCAVNRWPVVTRWR